MKNRSIRSLKLSAVLTLAILLPACDDAIGVGEDADITRVVLTIGGQLVVFNLGGAQSSFTLSEGTHPVDAIAYSGNDRLDLGGDFELAINSNDEDVAIFSLLSNLSGTLVTAPGNASLSVSIVRGGDDEFGPFDVSVTVD
ncbi:MAG: hypothetical protein ACREKM_09630 [Longimicrobiales bacterium]